MGFSLDSIKKISSISSVTDALNTLQGGITTLSNIDFSKKYLWNVNFIKTLTHTLPSEFIDNFPLVDFDLEEANLETYSRDFFMSTYKVPLKSKERMLKLTFFDNSNNDVFNWFKDWINVDILNHGNYTSCIEDKHERSGLWSNGISATGKVEPTRKIIVEKLLPDLSVSHRQILTIFPEGELVFNGSSESGLNVYSMNFVIVDTDTQTVGKNQSSNALVRASLGLVRNVFGDTVGGSVMDKALNLDKNKMKISNFL